MKLKMFLFPLKLSLIIMLSENFQRFLYRMITDKRSSVADTARVDCVVLGSGVLFSCYSL